MKHFNLRNLAILLLIIAATIVIWVLVWGNFLDGDFHVPDANKADKIGKFISALVIPLFSLGGALLVIENLRATTLQNFISNFFKLLDFHHKFADNIKDEIDYISNWEALSSGRAFFDDLCWRIAIDFEYLNTRNKSLPVPVVNPSILLGLQETQDKALLILSDTDRTLLVKIYDHYYHIHQSVLGQYFTNLYHIVSFVDTYSGLSLQAKKIHMKILRAQLTNYEILLLAYNCFHDYGSKFKPLVEKYELIKNLNNELHVPDTRKKRIILPDIIEAEFFHLKQQKWSV